MRLSALIVDDESLARENLKMLVTEFCPELEVVALADGVEEARVQIKKHRPNVVFLDIRMPSGNEGFDLLSEIDTYNFMVVFVTAFKDYAFKAFKANAIHYILKPIDIEELKIATKKLLDAHGIIQREPQAYNDYKKSISNATRAIESGEEKAPEKITVPHARGFHIVKSGTIVCFESDGRYTKVHLKNGSVLTDSRSLRNFEEMFQNAQFFRVHKSYIVNLDHIQEYLNHEGHIALMPNNLHVPIARSRLVDFMSSLK